MTVVRTFAARMRLRRGLRRAVEAYPYLTGPKARQRAQAWIEQVEQGDPTMTSEESTQVAVRMQAPLLARIDAYAEHIRAEVKGATFTRADAIRALLTQALDARDETKDEA